MRVTNNMITANTKSNINGNKVLVDKYNTQMTTQKKINRPSEDPVVAIRSLRMQTSLSHITQYLDNNISDANAWLDVTETALTNMKKILTDIRTQCVNGSTDTLTADDRRTILKQLQAMSDQVYSEGNADYAAKHWTVLTTWANYLLEKGLDPDNQLCTDDFAGHFAHNANLSIKAIMGIAGYGKLAGMLGQESTSKEYIQKAKDMAEEWVKMANAGDHYRLTFDQPDTWSQKYNLIWDQIFGLNIFPEIVAEREVDFYLTQQNKYGLPLDSRKTYTKSDWILWSACLIDDAEKFQALINPVHKYANETQTRIPLSDWHETTDGKSVGFRARSVVGGYWMKMLIEKMKH